MASESISGGNRATARFAGGEPAEVPADEVESTGRTVRSDHVPSTGRPRRRSRRGSGSRPGGSPCCSRRRRRSGPRPGARCGRWTGARRTAPRRLGWSGTPRHRPGQVRLTALTRRGGQALAAALPGRGGSRAAGPGRISASAWQLVPCDGEPPTACRQSALRTTEPVRSVRTPDDIARRVMQVAQPRSRLAEPSRSPIRFSS
jgi:hypothetical protein